MSEFPRSECSVGGMETWSGESLDEPRVAYDNDTSAVITVSLP